jgi:nitric oxide reductase subunit C
MSRVKVVLWAGILVCTIVFLGLCVDSLRQMRARTHADQISAEVVEGKWIWQSYTCNDCHTVLGIGGYYAPDVTKSYATRGELWVRKFLQNPEAMYPESRQMPNYHFTEAQITPLVAYLKWVSEVDTNNWPPPPKVARAAAAETPEGRKIILAQNCTLCHVLNGSGGTVAPDLTHAGNRRSKDWILQQLVDPRSHYPDSVMPSFAQLPQNEREAVADYLANLK